MPNALICAPDAAKIEANRAQSVAWRTVKAEPRETAWNPRETAWNPAELCRFRLEVRLQTSVF